MGVIKYSLEPGMKFGMLTAIRDLHEKDSRGDSLWLFKCDCGVEKAMRRCRVAGGYARSCGCQKDSSGKKHGLYKTTLYKRWKYMNERCASTKGVHKRRYADRKITVCEEWRDFIPFYKWAMENGYRDDLTLDRIDNNGIYEPSNCRWATIKQQANNKECTVRISWGGEEHSISEWAELLNIQRSTLYKRYRKGDRGAYLFRDVGG